jgi:hypothetical protein
VVELLAAVPAPAVNRRYAGDIRQPHVAPAKDHAGVVGGEAASLNGGHAGGLDVASDLRYVQSRTAHLPPSATTMREGSIFSCTSAM